MHIVKVKDRYQVTIPREIRREFGIKKGDSLKFEIRENEIILKPGSLQMEMKFIPHDQDAELEMEA